MAVKAQPLWRGRAGLAALTLLLCGICTGPVLAILGGAFEAVFSGHALGIDAALIRACLGSLYLLVFGAGAASLLGVSAALLVQLCAFPGRRLFAALLAAPLAAPAYVLAYAYGGLMALGAPLAGLGWDGQMRTAFVFALAFYPYVFLATRAGLRSQAGSAIEAARSLGAGPWSILWRVTLPLARPAIAAGAALAAMETLADYGATSYFGASSLAAGVFHAWYALASPAFALQFCAILLIAAFVLLRVEQNGRRGALAGPALEREQAATRRYHLAGPAAFAATLGCAGLSVLGCLLPLGWLVRLALLDGGDWGRLMLPLVRSLTLAFSGGLLTLGLALAIAALARRGGAIGRAGAQFSAIGYAAPGAVVALGALAWLAFVRHAGWLGGLTSGASLALLLWAYSARFAASGVQPLAAGFARISANQDDAARSLGARPWQRLLRVDLPLIWPSALVSGVIIFVEILKELPATLILRPFDWDTLAVRAHAYAADERLTQAAAPALLITMAGALSLLLAAKVLAHPPAHFQRKRNRGFVQKNTFNQSINPLSGEKPASTFSQSGQAGPKP